MVYKPQETCLKSLNNAVSSQSSVMLWKGYCTVGQSYYDLHYGEHFCPGGSENTPNHRAQGVKSPVISPFEHLVQLELTTIINISILIISVPSLKYGSKTEKYTLFL